MKEAKTNQTTEESPLLEALVNGDICIKLRISSGKSKPSHDFSMALTVRVKDILTEEDIRESTANKLWAPYIRESTANKLRDRLQKDDRLQKESKNEAAEFPYQDKPNPRDGPIHTYWGSTTEMDNLRCSVEDALREKFGQFDSIRDVVRMEATDILAKKIDKLEQLVKSKFGK